ncbi:MAG: nitrilase-related carbon-nitrogen hydrolase, partial [Candidatus Thorarchaeota archaeon]
MDFSVSLIQMSCTEGNRKENFKNATEMLSGQTTKTSMEFIILPELFAIGFRYTDYKGVGQGVPGPTSEFIQNLAEEHSAYVVGTDIEQIGEKYFNTLVMSSPKGKIVAEYRKMHPFQSEKDVFAGGESLVIVEVGGIKVGFGICYDLRFPELFRGLALNGAEIVLIPAAWPDPRSQHWDTLVRARAIENQLYVAATNRMGWAFDKKT